MAQNEKYELGIKGDSRKSEILTIDHSTGLAQIDICERGQTVAMRWRGSAGAGEVTQFIAQADRKL